MIASIALFSISLNASTIQAQSAPVPPSLAEPLFVRVIKHDGPTKAQAMTSLCMIYTDKIVRSKTLPLLEATTESTESLVLNGNQALEELMDAASQGALEEKKLEGLAFSKTYRAQKPGDLNKITLLEINKASEMTKKNLSEAAQALVLQIDQLCDR